MVKSLPSFFVFTLIFVLSSCIPSNSQLGKRGQTGVNSLSSGRLLYAEALGRTDDQQILLSVIKRRYNETFSLVRVSSINANISFASSADVQLGIGPTSNFAGNLVPFSGGVVYEENPTISYVPVRGQDYLQILLTPIPIDIYTLLLNSSLDRKLAFTLLTSQINGIRSPMYWGNLSTYDQAEFQQLATMIERQLDDGILSLVQIQSNQVAFEFIPRTETDWNEVKRMAELLKLDLPDDRESRILIPLYLRRYESGAQGIFISTPTLDEVVTVMGQAVDIPQEHESQGFTTPDLGNGWLRETMSIRISEEEPEGYASAVFFDGYWYYIDRSDRQTKEAFQLLRNCIMLRMNTVSTRPDEAPLLMIPVGQ